jgi:tRNA A37 N6-isopentenylltransferase MiaA
MATASSARANPSRLAKKPEIISRVTELLRERDIENRKSVALAADRATVSKTWILTMLRENVERAMAVKPVLDKDGNPTGEYQYNGFVANKALELLGREIGMFVERHELTLAQRLTEMPEDQRAAEMFDLVQRAKERLAQLRGIGGGQRVIEGSSTEVRDGSDVEDGEPPEE